MELNIYPQNPSESAGEYAYRVLRRNIIWAVLRPGECVSPAGVAEALGSSRTPVQAAFVRLTGDGLLNVYPQRGSYVSKIDVARIRESVRMRILCDQTALRLLCEQGVGEPGRLALELNFQKQQLCWEKNMLQEMFELDNAWHETAYRLCGMEHIFQAVQSVCADHLRIRFLKLNARIRGGQTLEEHEALNRAIFARDTALACRLSYEHVQRIGWDLDAVYRAYPDYFINWEQRPSFELDYRQETYYIN